jgi:hypothetical protein
MTKNSLRAFASLLVLTVPGLALAKAPAKTDAPLKASMSAPVKASTSGPSADKGADKGSAEHKNGAAAPKKGSNKKDAAKTDKSDSNSAKH